MSKEKRLRACLEELTAVLQKHEAGLSFNETGEMWLHFRDSPYSPRLYFLTGIPTDSKGEFVELENRCL